MASCYYKPDGISLCRSGANKMEGGGRLLAVLYGNMFVTRLSHSCDCRVTIVNLTIFLSWNYNAIHSTIDSACHGLVVFYHSDFF